MTTAESSHPMQKCKLVFLGDQSVGKTSLISRFIYDTFDSAYQATISIDFVPKTMYLPERTVRMYLWDAAGRDRYRYLITSYIRECALAIVVYDTTNRESFETTSKWIEEMLRERHGDVVIMLVGNKIDLIEKRQVTTDEGEEQANKYNVMFMETSAKGGYNVNHLFERMANALPPVEKRDQDHLEKVALSSPADQTPFSKCVI
ncbi:ras-domain-containing protein [Hesseltinella vesiculosa]|uniref:Ras-domain-containing protein n=1 Tax=Hesseltinella vesiculosa TaxID=101127 RepID=A0A1X2G499_9FUNG|nr:ras-domain-containing protein [Hesseltinella vesiculosa]